jgi:hypothetical protein
MYMTPEEKFIHKFLKENPKTSCVSSDGNTMYIVDPRLDDDLVHFLRSPDQKNFNDMSDEERKRTLEDFVLDYVNAERKFKN